MPAAIAARAADPPPTRRRRSLAVLMVPVLRVAVLRVAVLRVANATPPAHTPAVMRRGPPSRASSTSGPAPGPGRHRPGGDRRRATSCGSLRPACRRPRRPAPARAAAVWPPPRRRRRVPRARRARRRRTVEGAGPGETDGIAAQAGQPSRPEAGPQREPPQAPVEKRGAHEPQRPPAPWREREREQDPRHDRGAGHAAPARPVAHKSAWPRPGRRGDAGGDSDPAVRRAGHRDAPEAGQPRLNAGRPQQVVHPVPERRRGSAPRGRRPVDR